MGKNAALLEKGELISPLGVWAAEGARMGEAGLTPGAQNKPVICICLETMGVLPGATPPRKQRTTAGVQVLRLFSSRAATLSKTASDNGMPTI